MAATSRIRNTVIRSALPMIPNVGFRRGEGEEALDFFSRVAKAMGFAFRFDPTLAAADCLDLETSTFVLREAVVTRSQARGRLTLTRDQALVAGGAEQLMVLVLESGQIQFSSGPEVRVVKAGEIVVVDLRQTCQLIEQDQVLTNIVMARTTLPESLHNRRLHGLVIEADHPLAPLLSDLTRGLTQRWPLMSLDQATSVLGHLTGLLGSALEDIVDDQAESASIVGSVEALVEKHLADRELTPEWLCEQLTLSRATLYRTFEHYGGVASYIRDHRLQRAMQLATAQPGCTLKNASLQCGFSSAAQLNRSFVSKFGLSYPEAVKGRSEANVLSSAVNRELTNSWKKRTGHV